MVSYGDFGAEGADFFNDLLLNTLVSPMRVWSYAVRDWDLAITGDQCFLKTALRGGYEIGPGDHGLGIETWRSLSGSNVINNITPRNFK